MPAVATISSSLSGSRIERRGASAWRSDRRRAGPGAASTSASSSSSSKSMMSLLEDEDEEDATTAVARSAGIGSGVSSGFSSAVPIQKNSGNVMMLRKSPLHTSGCAGFSVKATASSVCAGYTTVPRSLSRPCAKFTYSSGFGEFISASSPSTPPAPVTCAMSRCPGSCSR